MNKGIMAKILFVMALAAPAGVCNGH